MSDSTGQRPTGGAAETLPALGLLEVSVPLRIAEIAGWTPEARLAVAREAGQHIACHGDDLMFRSKPGAGAAAFNQLTTGLACAAYQPGGITFAGYHFCTDHQACLDAIQAAAG